MRAALRSAPFESVARWLQVLPPDRFPSLDELNALIEPGVKSGGGAPIVFVEATAGQVGYEATVFRTGQVPTRTENWHDFFNALVWLSFPRTKAAINHRHCRELQRDDLAPGRRGAARDVLSLFDEGGVIVTSSNASLLELLRRFEWKALFWERRKEVLEHMGFLVFGHAILEKLLQPYKAVTAKALLLDVPEAFLSLPLVAQIAAADERAARWFADEPLDSTRALGPLPVLGVPGWADNGAEAFYDDARVFRPGYRSQGTAGTAGPGG